MKYHSRDRELVLSAVCTEWGKKLVKQFDSSKLVKVVAEQRKFGDDPERYAASFFFEDGECVTILDSFSTGYRGEGPWGLHDVLVAFGLPEEQAQDVFTKKNVHTFYFRTPPP